MMREKREYISQVPKEVEQFFDEEYRSKEIGLLIGALAKAQGEYKKLIPNERSPGGKFANLQAILEATREALSNNGLGFYQYLHLLDEGSGAALLKTVLGHESGQYIISCARIVPGKNERQTGNIYEIHKRFHALMILGIAPSSNDPLAFDDNGNELAEEQLIEQLRKPKEDKKPELDYLETINNEQHSELLIELNNYEELAKDIMETYSIQTLADLPKSEYHKCRNKILKIKKTYEEYLNSKKQY